MIYLLHFLHCGTTVSIKSQTFITNWTFEYYFCSVNVLITQSLLRINGIRHQTGPFIFIYIGPNYGSFLVEMRGHWLIKKTNRRVVKKLSCGKFVLSSTSLCYCEWKRVDEKRLMLDKVKIISPTFDQVLRLQRLPQQLCKLNLTCTLINTTQKGTNLLFHPHSSMHATELYTVHTRSKP